MGHHDPFVRVRGHVLREVRVAAGLPLAAVAGGVHGKSTISRIESGRQQQLRLSVLRALVNRLGGGVGPTVPLELWPRAIMERAIGFVHRWHFAEVRQLLTLRGAVAAPPDAASDVRARVARAWTLVQQGRAVEADALQWWAWTAYNRGESDDGVWAQITESEARLQHGAAAAAGRAAADAVRHAETPFAVAVARAACARLFHQTGAIAEGLAVTEPALDQLDTAPLYARARLLHARGLLLRDAGDLTAAQDALRGAVGAALEIANYLLAAQGERLMGEIAEQQGDVAAADAAFISAAAHYIHSGNPHDSAAAVGRAIEHHSASPLPLQLQWVSAPTGRGRAHRAPR